MMYGHPLAGLTSRAAIRARLVAGAVGALLGAAALAVILYRAGIWT